jgi:hypothetical protein
MITTRKEACELIANMLNTGINLEGESLEKVIFAVNEDLQVRDWLMGIPGTWSLQEGIAFTQYMAINSTQEDSVPFIAVQAQFQYESGETTKAELLLNHALQINSNYSLAMLLKRVMHAGWPASSFIPMREQLHPKVVEECYGEEGTKPIQLMEEVNG